MNSSAPDAHPYLASGGRELWFGSSRAGGAFGAPVVVPELNANANEEPGWLSPDGCRLYFSSARIAGNGTKRDIYVAERTP